MQPLFRLELISFCTGGADFSSFIHGRRDEQNEDRWDGDSEGGKKNPRRYAIGVVQKDGIHLSTLTGIVLLKPTYGYLDANAKKKGKEGKILRNLN
jgi:RPC5 protein